MGLISISLCVKWMRALVKLFCFSGSVEVAEDTILFFLWMIRYNVLVSHGTLIRFCT